MVLQAARELRRRNGPRAVLFVGAGTFLHVTWNT
jgi:hypothetical protein